VSCLPNVFLSHVLRTLKTAGKVSIRKVLNSFVDGSHSVLNFLPQKMRDGISKFCGKKLKTTKARNSKIYLDRVNTIHLVSTLFPGIPLDDAMSISSKYHETDEEWDNDVYHNDQSEQLFVPMPMCKRCRHN